MTSSTSNLINPIGNQSQWNARSKSVIEEDYPEIDDNKPDMNNQLDVLANSCPNVPVPIDKTPSLLEEVSPKKTEEKQMIYTVAQILPTNAQPNDDESDNKSFTQNQQQASSNRIVQKFYCIFPGNGYNILKQAMNRKKNWVELPQRQAYEGRCNFIWKPCNFDYQQYCVIDKFHYHAIHAHKRRNVQRKEFQYGLPFEENNYDVNFSQELVVSHLAHIWQITTKTGLIRCLKAYYNKFQNAIENGYSVFDSTPTTYVVSSNFDTHEYQQFVKRFKDIRDGGGYVDEETVPSKHCSQNLWIVKPANDNQGKGIKIFNQMDQINRCINQNGQYSYWVIQKYLERPLLYKGRKFDIRVWAVALSNDDFFFCNRGYIRTSSSEYDTENLQDEYIHLTNNCLQMKDQQNYGKHEQGNTVSYQQFQEFLDEEYRKYNLDFNRDFVQRMKDLALDCFLSGKSSINPCERGNSFEFLGFDFMIDEDFRIWLIEANTNPYIGIYNDSMQDILPNMLDGLFKIVLDPIFERLSTEKQNKIEEQTCWDLLYSEQRKVNKRRDATEGIYPVEELAQKVFKPVTPRNDRNEKSNQSSSPNKMSTKAVQISTKGKQQQPDQLDNIANQDIKLDQVVEVDDSNGSSKRSHGIKMKNDLNLQSSIPHLKTINQQENLNLKKSQSVPQMKFTVSNNDLGGSFNLNQQTVDNSNSQQGQSNTINLDLRSQDNNYNKQISEVHNPVKTLVNKVRKLDPTYNTYNSKKVQIQNRILSTMLYWDLYSDEQIQDASTALRLLYHYTIQDLNTQKQKMRQLISLIGSNSVPLYIRLQLARNLNLIISNMSLKKSLIEDPIEALMTLRPMLKIAVENCGLDETKSSDKNMEELLYECVNIMVTLMSLDIKQNQFLGDSLDRLRVKQKGQDTGLLIIAVFLMSNTQNDNFKKHIEREFVDKLSLRDINHHFNQSENHYQIVGDLIDVPNHKQAIDQVLNERGQKFKEIQAKQYKQNQELRLQKEQREAQEKRERAQFLEERRKQIQDKIEQRARQQQIKQAQKLQRELQEKAERDRLEAERQAALREELKQKAEQRRRKQQMVQEMENKLKMERMEQMLKEEKEREIQRQLALQEWHARKRDNDPKYQKLRKMKMKVDQQKKAFDDFQQKQQELKMNLDNASQAQKDNIKMLQDFKTSNDNYLNNLQSPDKIQSKIQNQNEQIHQLMRSQVDHVNNKESPIEKPAGNQTKNDQAKDLQSRNLYPKYTQLQEKGSSVGMQNKNMTGNLSPIGRAKAAEAQKFILQKMQNQDKQSNSSVIAQKTYLNNDIETKESIKTKYGSNIKQRKHNFSPIMNQYELSQKIKGLQSTLVQSIGASVSYVDKLAQEKSRSTRREEQMKDMQSVQNRQDTSSILPQIANNNNKEDVYPSPASTKIVHQKGLFERLHSNEPFKNNSFKSRVFDSSTRKHRRIMSYVPVDNLVSNRSESNDPILASGSNQVEKTPVKPYPLDRDQNGRSDSVSMPKPSKSSIDKLAAALSGLGNQQKVPKLDSNFFSKQHSVLRKQKRNLSKRLYHGHGVLNVPKFDHFSARSSNEHTSNSAIGSPLKIKEFDKKSGSGGTINFPDIHNLKHDLTNFLHRRSSNMPPVDKKEQLKEIYGMKAKRNSVANE